MRMLTEKDATATTKALTHTQHMLCHKYAYADGEGCDCDENVCYAIRRALTHTSAYAMSYDAYVIVCYVIRMRMLT